MGETLSKIDVSFLTCPKCKYDFTYGYRVPSSSIDVAVNLGLSWNPIGDSCSIRNCY